MPRRLPDHAELRFIRTTGTGTVHLFVDEPANDGEAGVSIAAGLTAWAMGARPVIARCGAETFPVITPRHEPVGAFADKDLCHGCYRTLHPDDQWRAFEHPQPATA